MDEVELRGLVLAGGQSRRMGIDKGSLVYKDVSAIEQRIRLAQILRECGLPTYISIRKDQLLPELSGGFSVITDLEEELNSEAADFKFDKDRKSGGPGVGILSGHLKFQNCAWLVLACDFVFVDHASVEKLIAHRSRVGFSTAYQNEEGLVEPLFAIWEALTLTKFYRDFMDGHKSPRRMLELTNAVRIQSNNSRVLTNINSPADRVSYGLN